MAKKQTVDTNLFARTEAAPDMSEPDPVRPVGIGLRGSEWGELDLMAAQLGVTRHSLTLWIVRDFIKRFKDGWRPETDTKRVLRL
jgi:hypothetical protein